MPRGWTQHISPSRPGLSRSDPLDRSIILDWPFYHVTGQRVYDYTGRNRFGTVTGASWIGTQYGPALSHVRTESDMTESENLHSIITSLDRITFEVLFREQDTGADFTNRGIFCGVQQDSGNSQRVFGLHANTSNNRLLFRVTAGGTSTGLQVDNAYSTGRWHVAHGVYDGANIYLYMDGRLLAGPSARTGTLDGFNLDPNVLPLRLARTRIAGGGGDYLSVDIAHARLYGRGLTAGEVAKRTQLLLKETAPYQQCAWLIPWGKAPAAGGLPIPVAMYDYRRRRGA